MTSRSFAVSIVYVSLFDNFTLCFTYVFVTCFFCFFFVHANKKSDSLNNVLELLEKPSMRCKDDFGHLLC